MLFDPEIFFKRIKQYGRLWRFRHADEALIPPGCELLCPGCHHKNLSPLQSEQQKFRFLEKRLTPWRDCLVELQSAPKNLGYRERVTLNAKWNHETCAWSFGLMRGGELIAIPHCPVHSSRVNTVVEILRAHLPSLPQFPLYFFVQSGAQLILVVKASVRPDIAWLKHALPKLQAEAIEAVWLHLNPSTGKRIFAKNTWELLWGRACSYTAEGFAYSRTAFQQLSAELYHASLAAAFVFLQPDPQTDVVDLYSGIGISAHYWRKAGARVIGVEANGDAIMCAQQNVPDVEFLRGYCAARLPQLQGWISEYKKQKRLLYLNPPRTGVEQEVMQWLIEVYKPLRIAYLSCSPGTLARDLHDLTSSGYVVNRLLPYDFFPRTQHVEVLALLSQYS